MIIVKKEKLQVPGASIYYEVRGTGPVLLFIHGGGGDADKFLNVANHLANRYTVVTYDRRGHSRSNLANPTEDYRVKTHSNDAHLLLAELTNERAYVFGSSSGAVIGLDLSMRYPHQVRTLIPHEPVLLQLLFGDEQVQAKQFMENLKKDLRLEILKLSSSLDRESHDQSHQLNDEQTKRIIRNLEYFVTYEIPGICRHTFDLDVLKSSLTRVLSAGGSASREFFAYHCAMALGEQLETGIVEFPGHHNGYKIHHKEFAERLHNVLQNG